MSFEIAPGSPAEIIARWEAKQAKGAPQPEAPTLHFHLPPLGTKEIVENVMYDKGGWKTLQQTAVEDEATKRAKAFSDRYEMNEIPRPEFEDDWGFGI